MAWSSLPRSGRIGISPQIRWKARSASKTGGSQIVAHNGKVFCYPVNGNLTAWDGRTGNVIKVYDQTIKPDPIVSTQEDNVPSHAMTYSTIFFHQGKMFQSYKNHLWMLDETTGNVLWHRQEATDSNWIWQPAPGYYIAVSEDAKGTESKQPILIMKRTR